MNLAPEYYMLALYIHLQSHADYYTDSGWQKDFSFYDEDAAAEYCYVSIAALRAEAIRLLQKHDAIRVIEDPFGPTIWQKTDALEDLADQLSDSKASVFFRATASGDPKGWLYAALQKLNTTAEGLNITSADFHQTPMGEFTLEATAEVKDAGAVDEWAPIPIEQSDATLQHAIVKLDDTIKQVEESNGYAAAHAEERRYVLDGLKSLSNTLKTAGSVSIRYLKHNGFQMLKLIGDRFKSTAIDQSAKATSDALLHLVKKAAEWALNYLTGSAPGV